VVLDGDLLTGDLYLLLGRSGGYAVGLYAL
jgi:hypothetical protein